MRRQERTTARTAASSGSAARSWSRPAGDRASASGAARVRTPAVVATGGKPLGAHTRVAMESRFGHDFSDVRVHADEQAHASAAEVGAKAYAVGSDVVFGAGLYQPDTAAGLELIAHELTHVVQQEGSPSAAAGELAVSRPTDAAEVEATRAGEAAASGQPVSVQVGSGPSVQRDLLDDIAKYAGLGGGVVGAGLSAAGGGAAAAAPWVTGPIAAGLLGAYTGKALNDYTSVGGHTQESLGGFDALMTDPGERSWFLQQEESMTDNWAQGNYGSSILSGAKLAGGATLGALGGIGGGLVDAGEWVMDLF